MDEFILVTKKGILEKLLKKIINYSNNLGFMFIFFIVIIAIRVKYSLSLSMPIASFIFKHVNTMVIGWFPGWTSSTSSVMRTKCLN